ncbi:glycoside hydrolase family 16 protein [Schizophyllum commune Tattone D]|nr:glycoside hydrolase family 16 protein [Schizophyllum commune Tattone D]
MLAFSLRLISLALVLNSVAARDGFEYRAKHRAHGNSTLQTRKTWTLADKYQGQDFLDKWDFFSQADPTHGSVNYQDKSSAQSKNLAYVQDDGAFVMAVDDQTQLSVGDKRDSVRISSKKSYTQGLFIADIWAMPHGCSVWPAWWTVGPNWPNGGEIDVLEGVHDQHVNQYTLHTSQGCSIDTSVDVTGTLGNQQCAVGGGDNTGCAFTDSDPTSYGNPFNVLAGGVYAHTWTDEGIKIWHFPRTSIPADITTGNPNPDSWGAPAAFFSASSCDMGSHFYDHVLTFDITLCGDWAGSTYGSAGCPGSCAERVANPANFKYAKFKINYVAVYQ